MPAARTWTHRAIAQRKSLRFAVLAMLPIILAAAAWTPGRLQLSARPLAAVHTSTSTPSSSGQPLRAAFYYPWFPEAWNQQGLNPFTHYHPSLGFYDSSNQSVIAAHIAAMQYGNVQVGIASWWGQGTMTDQRIPLLLNAAHGTGFQWTLYYEPALTASGVVSDLTYINQHYGSDPNFLHVNGKPVVFVYTRAVASCADVATWTANNQGDYLNLQVFAGYATCAQQPDSWHQYGPASRTAPQGQYSFSISPGYWKATDITPLLARDPAAFTTACQQMVASGAKWQLVTTFNEWGEGTSVESAQEWATASGYGAYLDALHACPARVVAAVGSDNSPWQQRDGGGWNLLGGGLLGAPAVVSVPQGNVGSPLYIGVGGDHDLFVRTASHIWQRLDASPVYCIDNPAATLSGGILTVTCQGGDHGLYRAQQGGILPDVLPLFHISNWTALGGFLTAGPAVAAVPGRGIDIMVLGTSNAIYEYYSGGFHADAFRCIGHPALATDPAGMSYFGCHGLDGALWWSQNDGSTNAGNWFNTASLGGGILDGPAIAATNLGPTFYVEGLDHAMYERGLNGGYRSDGGYIKFGTGAAALF